jgi:hypothetical protein
MVLTPINKNCVQFLISRFGLFSCNLRIITTNANTYLNASVTYSQKLLTTLGKVLQHHE